jgi:DNA-binding CsgD family transcriptional regulator
MRFFPMLDAQSTLGDAIALRMRGQIRAAAKAAAAARSSAEVGGQIVLTVAIAEQAAAAALAGDVAAAAAALAEADRVQRHTMALEQPMLELARLELRILQDGTDTAAGAARDLATRLRDEGLHGFEAHALHQLSRLGQVMPLDAARLAELAARVDEPFPLAAALHAGGLVAGDPDALARASRLYATHGLQLFAVEALAQRFVLLLRAGQVGAGAVADELAGLLATVDVRTVPVLRIAPPDLTPNEQKVADLVERGLDNAEISTTLFFTRRTTQTYLSRIYDKLGIHKRVDVPGIVRLHRALRVTPSKAATAFSTTD